MAASGVSPYEVALLAVAVSAAVMLPITFVILRAMRGLEQVRGMLTAAARSLGEALRVPQPQLQPVPVPPPPLPRAYDAQLVRDPAGDPNGEGPMVRCEAGKAYVWEGRVDVHGRSVESGPTGVMDGLEVHCLRGEARAFVVHEARVDDQPLVTSPAPIGAAHGPWRVPVALGGNKRLRVVLLAYGDGDLLVRPLVRWKQLHGDQAVA